MMNRKQVERHLRESGFAPKRNATHGTIWMDDSQGWIMLPRPNASKERHAQRNLLADVARVVRARPVAAQGHSNQATKPLKQDQEIQMTQPNKVETPKLKKLNHDTWAEVSRTIAEHSGPLITNGDRAAILNKKGLGTSQGKPWNAPSVGRYIASVAHRKGLGLEAPQAPPITQQTAPIQSPPKESGKTVIPDALAWLLLDETLSDKQKIGMMKAWAGL